MSTATLCCRLLPGLLLVAGGCASDRPEPSPAERTEPGSEEPARLDTQDWQLYTDFDHVYSIKIPPPFERVEDFQGVQKRFRAAGKEDPEAIAEMKISVFAPWSIDEAEFDRLRALLPGDALSLGELHLTKIKNLRLDPCTAFQYRIETAGVRGPTLGTTCVLEAYGITFFLETASEEDVAVYGPLYEAALGTFQAY